MFLTLQDYYNYQENDKLLLFDFNVSKELLLLKSIQNEELAEVCYIEHIIQETTLYEGKLGYIHQFEGQTPLSESKELKAKIEYLKTRAETIKNPKYKAKFYHLLWTHRVSKNMQYAKKAIDNYYIYLKATSVSSEENRESSLYCNYLEALFNLSQEVNYQKEEVVTFFTDIIESGNLNEYSKYRFIDFYISKGKNITQSNLHIFYEYIKINAKHESDRSITEKRLKLLIRLSKRLKQDEKPFHNKLGEHFANIANSKGDGLVANKYFLDALSHYKFAKNSEKTEEISVLIESNKKKIYLKPIKIELKNDLTIKWWKMMNKMTSEYSENASSEEIYMFIIHTDKIFPRANILNKGLTSPMLSIFNLTTFDKNLNIIKGKQEIISSYGNYIDNFSLITLHSLFTKGVKNQKISHLTLIDYLKNETWYGKNIYNTSKESSYAPFNWIELLEPSLKLFFNQYSTNLNNNSSENQGYILAIDSLVIKFEGVLREFSRRIDAQTIESNDYGTEERIAFEKLLDNPKFTKLVPQDDVALLKYLFTPMGLNLRNNIAHSFYRSQDYSFEIMYLLISALLKLGNFE